MGPVSSTMALKWSGIVTETSAGVTRNLADPGTDVAPGADIENRYPFGVHHTAIVADGFRSLSEGDQVEFEIVDGPKGLQASNVKKV